MALWSKLATKATEFMYFKTERFVQVRDIRVGLFLKALQALVFFYVLFDILRKGSYLQQETPSGIATPYEDANVLKRTTEAQLGALEYCRNTSKYNFRRDELNNYNGLQCIFKRAGVVTKSSSQISFTTNQAEDKVFYVRKRSAAACPKDGSRYLPGATLDLYVGGACVYSRQRHFLPAGVELMNMTFWHSYQSSQVHKTGSLPKTHVRRKGSTKNLYTFPAGKTPSLSVRQWLNYSGVDLDLPLDQQPWFANNTDAKPDPGLQGIGTSSGKYPYVRVMGVQILMTLNYYNYELGPGMLTGLKTREGDVTAILELEPLFVWSGPGSDIVYMNRLVADPQPLVVNGAPSNDNNDVPDFASTDMFANGVVFSFRTGGAVARFQYRALINSLIQGAVLLSIAQTITKFLVLYGLGVASALYQEFVREGVNYRREYARFGVQALVAGYVFHQLDTHKNNQLSAEEIYTGLQDSLGGKLHDKDLMLLTDFVMRHGDEDEATHKKRLEKGEVVDGVENTISLEEWVNIFTEDRVNCDALLRILQHEYQNTHMGDELKEQLDSAHPSMVQNPSKDTKDTTAAV